MTENDREYIKYLVRKEIPLSTIDETKRIMAACSDLADTLSNPVVTDEEKHGIIRQIFPENMQHFVINLCDGGAVSRMGSILDEYTELCIERQGSIRAVVRYVTPLTESQQADMKNFIKEKFNRTDVNIEYRCDPDIIGGFILNAGDYEYDKSYRTSLKLMRESLRHRANFHSDDEAPFADLDSDLDNAKRANDIISVLKSEVNDFDRKSGITETGYVTRMGDGIAMVHGMNHVMYGELVEFENGVRGIVQNIEMKSCGVVLLGDEYGITEGSTVMRTGKRAGVGVSDELLGRVVDALGAPIGRTGSYTCRRLFSN